MRAGGFLLLMAAAFPALAAAQVPAGGELQVNTYTTSGQFVPSVSVDAAGRTVVTWASAQEPFNLVGIKAQRLDAGGSRAGVEFQVSASSSSATYPRALSLPRGDFVLIWEYFSTRPLPIEVVAGRRFSAGGTPLGAEFAIPFNRASSPAAASTPGGFVVAWHQYDSYYNVNADIHAQRFDATGAKVGADFRVNTFTTGNQREPAVATNAQGDFLVVWHSAAQDGSGEGVYGQRFSAAGVALGAEFRVNGATSSDQTLPRAAASADGGFVVVWQSDGQDGSGTGVFGRRFGGDGTPLGTEFLVNAYTTADQFGPALAADANGDFVVSWTSGAQDGSQDGVFAQRFDGLAGRRGAEFRVNATTANAQGNSSVAVDPYGNFSIVWQSLGQDGSGLGVFAQRYGGLFPAALTVDPVAGSGSNGDGVLEPGETVEVRPQWRNLNGAAQTFGGALSGIAGPPGASYAITDATGDYGVVANGATAPCSDCYGVAVTNPPARPATHWDASVLESILPDAQGLRQRWVLHVGNSFGDVPPSNPFFRFIETLLHHGVTGGCTGTAYCPASPTTREQMAVFVLVAREGAGYAPPACAPPNIFGDVPETSLFCRYIEELANRGVVTGCGGGNYCPQQAVTRDQMAVFVLRTLDPALEPPACTTPVFADVPAASPFCL